MMRFALILAVLLAGLPSNSRAQPTPPAPEPPTLPPGPAPLPPDPAPTAPDPAAPTPDPAVPGPDPAPFPDHAETEDVDPDDDPLTTKTWRPARTFDLHWHVLYLPQRVLELAFMPFGLLMAATDRYRLDRRVGDLLELFDHRIVIRPRVKFAFTDGPGLGLTITRANLFDRRAELSASALYRTSNGDWQAELEYEHALLLPEGRGLRAKAEVELDQNRRYFGIGNATTVADRRVLAAEDQAVSAEIDLQGIDRYTYSATLEVALRRQTLLPGVSMKYPPVGTEGDSVTPPPGFEETAIYGDAKLVGRYDTRDTVGRPTRGWLVALAALARTDVTGKDLSALTLSGNARLHLPVIAKGRTLMLVLGGLAAIPLVPGNEIPLDSMAKLDRSNVRGYDRDRFFDRYVVHGSVEYRFPIYEYLGSRVGIDALLFVDGGTTFDNDSKPFDAIRYSVGAGLRGAHETRLIFSGFFAWSPEGPQLVFGAEKTL